MKCLKHIAYVGVIIGWLVPFCLPLNLTWLHVRRQLIYVIITALILIWRHFTTLSSRKWRLKFRNVIHDFLTWSFLELSHLFHWLAAYERNRLLSELGCQVLVNDFFSWHFGLNSMTLVTIVIHRVSMVVLHTNVIMFPQKISIILDCWVYMLILPVSVTITEEMLTLILNAIAMRFVMLGTLKISVLIHL